MSIDFLKRAALFAILLLAQGMVFNHIHLFGFATPLLTPLFVLHQRRNGTRWAMLMWCFALGLCTDIFANTPGVAAASLTLTGMVQPLMARLFAPRDSAEDFKPSLRTMSAGKYFWYTTMLVAVYAAAFFSLEYFSYFDWLWWIECFGGSLVLSLVLILALEHLRSHVQTK